jgi:hypothetical protein
MAISDIASALDRIAPRTGLTIKFSFTVAASGAQAITFHNPATAGGFTVGQGSLYVALKTTAAVHVVFGPVSVADPTNADMLLEQGDGLQDFILTPEMTHFKVKGDSGSGDFYLTVTGR